MKLYNRTRYSDDLMKTVIGGAARMIGARSLMISRP